MLQLKKIDDSTFQTFRIVGTSFEVEAKLSRPRFFSKSFLLTDTSIKVVLPIPFLTFSNFNISFAEQKSIWKFYITTKTLSITKQVKSIIKNKFAKVALDK